MPELGERLAIVCTDRGQHGMAELRTLRLMHGEGEHRLHLGQAAGQRLLLALGGRIPVLAEQAIELPEAAWNNFAPGLALASSRHETQYSRLFRS